MRIQSVLLFMRRLTQDVHISGAAWACGLQQEEIATSRLHLPHQPLHQPLKLIVAADAAQVQRLRPLLTKIILLRLQPLCLTVL